MPPPSPERHRVSAGRAGTPSGLAGKRQGPAKRVRLALEILGAYAQARRELRRAPIADAVAKLRSPQPKTAGPVGLAALQEAQHLGSAVTRLLALVPGDTRCLARALVLTRLLAKRGIPSKLVIGARSGPDFLAHAWVEYCGDPVLAAGDGSFGRLVEL